MDYYKIAFTKFVDFSTRSSRKAYCYFFLYNFLAGLAIGIVATLLAMVTRIPSLANISSLYGLVAFIPSLALVVRRLHDINRSGWWILINVIPLIGLIVFLFFIFKKGDDTENLYGPNPTSGEMAAIAQNLTSETPTPTQQ